MNEPKPRLSLTDQCPNCGRFIERDGDGFYDRECRANDSSEVFQFCAERCADQFHEKRMDSIGAAR